MKKLYTLGATTVSSVALAVSLSSPAFAQTSYNQTTTSNQAYSANSTSHGHEGESEDSHKHGSDDNKNATYQNSQNQSEDNHGGGKDDNDQKEHQDCHVKANSGNQDNQVKYPSHTQCDKTVAKTASANTTNSNSSAAKTGQAQPTSLPNAGAGNIALIGALVAVAGYVANLLRFKFLGQQ